MEKVFDSFMNEEQNMFTDFFHKKTKNKQDIVIIMLNKMFNLMNC